MTDLFSVADGMQDARIALGLPDPEKDWSMYLCKERNGYAVTDDLRLAAGKKPLLIHAFGPPEAKFKYLRDCSREHQETGAPTYIIIYDNQNGRFKGVWKKK